MIQEIQSDQGIALLQETVQQLHGVQKNYDFLMEFIGEAPLVLLGEASHGTAEFYRERAQITKRLIQEKGFTAVAVEADWPDAYRVNRYVFGRSRDASSQEALADFTRFPIWMWRNNEVMEFITWLRAYNDAQPAGRPKAGFYGLDLYSLRASMEGVLVYLDRIDPESARRARARYACFDHYGDDSQSYAYATGVGLTRTCENEVLAQLQDLRRHAEDYLRRDGFVAEDEFFFAEQNARLVKNAEKYYRSMFHGRISTWNLRDRHMVETFNALRGHLSRRLPRPKIVVWEHNSHIGDARATQMGESGELNVGQLVREQYGEQAVLIGFTTYRGSVTAASEWDGPMERKRVRPALAESYEGLFHRAGIPQFLLTWKNARLTEYLRARRLERAIGVIYLPDTERLSHYFYAQLPAQFDAILHIDTTHAVEPLDQPSGWVTTDVPETYPTGM